MAVQPLAPGLLYRVCKPDQFEFVTTAELAEMADMPGQSRAEEAIRFGIGIKRAGYNLFALGPGGLGKDDMIHRFLAPYAAREPIPSDWCYVYDFGDAYRPNALEMPAGEGTKFRDRMGRFVDDLQSSVPAIFESDDYRARIEVINDEFKERQENAFAGLRSEAETRDLTLVRTPAGLALAPVANGEVITPEDFNRLPEDTRTKIEHDMKELQEKLLSIMREVPQWNQERREKARSINREMVKFTVDHLINAIRADYGAVPEVLDYLDGVTNDVVENVDLFTSRPDEQMPTFPGMSRPQPEPPFHRYHVNVIVDNSAIPGAPLVYEDNPTHQNLIGRIEHKVEMGALVTDFALIKPGALHRAAGGYLIIDARKLLMQPFAWDALKRTLKSGEIRVEGLERSFSVISTVSLEPEPIPLKAKVILTGERSLYYLLCQLDDEFGELFKVSVDFEDDMDRNNGALLPYAQLIATLAKRDGLLPVDRLGVARIIEQSSRLAGDAEKLSTRFDQVADLVREADFWAGKAGSDTVTADHVQTAIDAQLRRADRIRERTLEMIDRNVVLIDTSGEKTGQINGLSVLMLGNTSFGRPSRITARVYVGTGDVVDIEREVKLGGPTHSKGVLILTSYLRSQFASDQPLSLTASLVFEQSYGGVDGDSASSAELYALLSALADAPIKQSLAVTGSVNQYGEVQAIGGVNEKIEGFFDVCDKRGLTGDQGVLIPRANVKNLMLKAAVVAAVEHGRFHIYPIESIDDGIEILTGVRAGKPSARHLYEKGTLYRRVHDRLKAMARKRRSFGPGWEGHDRRDKKAETS
ncbi:MAG: AAA family ATPase [Rhodospirillales bacterium]|nr:AAA family ATPase [Rhodospirillales bacterium]